MSKGPLIPPHGGYRNLRSFRTAQQVYDATLVFCERFVEKRSRTFDQMVQAARSGVQNIAEGSMASATSKKMEIKLTNVARASLEELLLDFEDFLRHRGLRQWDKDSPEAIAIRSRFRGQEPGAPEQPSLRRVSDTLDIRTASPEVAANTIICLINQASFLLRRQIQQLERRFVEEGGFTERMYHRRKAQNTDSI